MAIVRWKPERELETWSPFRDLMNIQREIGRVFDSLFSDVDGGRMTMEWSPRVDVLENNDSYILRAELPGVNKNDVKITLRDNILTIKGEKKQEKEEKDVNFHRTERMYGSFERSFTLPSGVKNDKIDATYKDGVLTITLPKVEEAKPKEIEVKVSYFHGDQIMETWAQNQEKKMSFLDFLSDSAFKRREIQKTIKLLQMDYLTTLRISSNLSVHAKWIPYPFLQERVRKISESLRKQSELLREQIIKLGGELPPLSSEQISLSDHRQNVKKLVQELENTSKLYETYAHQRNIVEQNESSHLLSILLDNTKKIKEELTDIVMRLS
jgi:HSP20 family protein